MQTIQLELPEDLPIINTDITAPPFVKFTEWFNGELCKDHVKWAHNFVLSTVDEEGAPWGRTVSLHYYDDRGFIFCSAMYGPKGIYC